MEERSIPAAGSSSGGGRFVVWLHGLGDCGSANELIADHFSAAAFSAARWAFPTAPTAPRHMQPSEKSVRDEEDVLRAVQIVHAMIDRKLLPEQTRKTCALSIASVLLYPKALGGCAVFSGFVPFNTSSIAARVTDDAKKAPILWIHGGADSLIPIQEGQDGVKFLRGLGMSCEFKAARAQRVAASSTILIPSCQVPNDPLTPTNSALRLARPDGGRASSSSPGGGGFLLWLHGSGGSGDESRAEVAPYFAAPGLASSVRMSFPTAPTARIACYGELPFITCPRPGGPSRAQNGDTTRSVSLTPLLNCGAAAGDAVITAWFGIGEVPITAVTNRPMLLIL
ncbi:hypothetical protein HU200_006591 [Digitaria exilis]|uniref:Phospholipase/carboxylesterase/thioesterase domain-containing protein n=1 Tax=Digitaria exilis TaxID=1010633 RepID=A0A835FPU0_9POAL|nr:hypothetical protein HU200_006591 [Digitaria exilis]